MTVCDIWLINVQIFKVITKMQKIMNMNRRLRVFLKQILRKKIGLKMEKGISMVTMKEMNMVAELMEISMKAVKEKIVTLEVMEDISMVMAKDIILVMMNSKKVTDSLMLKMIMIHLKLWRRKLISSMTMECLSVEFVKMLSCGRRM